MLTFNLEWRLHFPTVFGTDSWFDSVAIISPFWGLVDEFTMALIEDEYPNARPHVYYQVYTRSIDMTNETKSILERAALDVSESGTSFYSTGLYPWDLWRG